jgi:GT2 family glycosyltransferase
MNTDVSADIARSVKGDVVAPPVVASMVVYQPGPWFVESLQALAAQTYPQLQTLFLVVGTHDGDGEGIDTDLTELIHSVLPQAVVRHIEGNPGFGLVSNEVARLVDGEGGFFCLLHDDVALEPEAIERLIEETYRSNAGLVGPKLVEWDDPTILQSVGLNVDRIGEVEPLIGDNEKDQEQHDSVRDVFALSSACLLIRSDLFRELGGFNRQIDFFGEELDLCWRAHLSGARVLIVPAAKARHRNGIDSRATNVERTSAQARNRVRTVVTLSGGLQLPFVMLQMLVASVVQVVAGIFGGGFTAALASLRASLAVIIDLPYVLRRRSEVRPLRLVAASEIHDLQVSGSARFSSFVRRRSRRIQQASLAQKDRKDAVKHQRFVTNVFIAIIAFVLLGSRSFVLHGVSRIGEFLPMRAVSESPRALVTSFVSGWTQGGFGSAGSNSSGYVLMALAGAISFGRTGSLQTVLIIGTVFVGAFGMWKVPTGYFSLRARAIGMAMYVAVPLPYVALSKGRLSDLLVYAALPWVLRLFVRAELGLRGAKQTQLLATAVLFAAVVFAFVPTFLAIVVWVAIAWIIGGFIAQANLRQAIAVGRIVVALVVGALVLNAPWVSQFANAQWMDHFIGNQAASVQRVGFTQLARFDGGLLRFGVIALGLYIPVFVSVVVTRSNTFIWATRSLSLVVLTGMLIVAIDANVVNIAAPSFGQLSAIVACGLALGAGALASFVFDDELTLAYRWWKPVVACAVVASFVGALPAVSMAVGGSWNQSKTAIADLYTQMQANPPEGDYNVVYVGRSEVLPVSSLRVSDEVAFAVADDGELTMRDRWAKPNDLSSNVESALHAIIRRETVRGGRLLAPLAVRYVVVPQIDGGESTIEKPLPLPEGLLAALSTQLDFRRVYLASDLVIYENMAWVPSLSILDDNSSALSKQAGDEVLLSSELKSTMPIARVGDVASVATEVGASTVHLAVPFSNQLRLDVAGADVQPRVAFGGTTAFDVSDGGPATLKYNTPISQYLFIVVQSLLWLLVMVAVFDIGRIQRRISQARNREVIVVGDQASPALSFATGGDQ